MLNYYEDHSTQRVRLIPDAFLDTSTAYTILVRGGADGIKDAAGNALAQRRNRDVYDEAPGETTHTLFDDNWVPDEIDSGENQPIELGLKFQSSASSCPASASVSTRARRTPGPRGRLWSASGQILAMATFSNETASGWQSVEFIVPVAITAGATYTVSYHTTTGHYSADQDCLLRRRRPVRSTPMAACIATGRGIPVAKPPGHVPGSRRSSRPRRRRIRRALVAFNTCARGATGVATNAVVDVTFSEAMDAATINSSTVRLLDGATPVAANVVTTRRTVYALASGSAGELEDLHGLVQRR